MIKIESFQNFVQMKILIFIAKLMRRNRKKAQTSAAPISEIKHFRKKFFSQTNIVLFIPKFCESDTPSTLYYNKIFGTFKTQNWNQYRLLALRRVNRKRKRVQGKGSYFIFLYLMQKIYYYQLIPSCIGV